MHEERRHGPTSSPGRRPTRGRRVGLTLAALVAVVAVTVTTVAVRDLMADDVPRRLQVEGPAARSDGPDEVTVTTSDEEAVVAILERVLDPDLAPTERAALVEPGGPDRPVAADVFASFDGLAASAGAHVEDATSTVELLAADVAVATTDIPMTGGYGPSARVRDLMFHRSAQGWRLTYESLCGLANLAPLVGRPSGCPGLGVVHHATGLPDVRTLLVGHGQEASRAAPIVLADGSPSSVRTSRWAWLVDYPTAELGGGAPSAPAELVRVDGVHRYRADGVHIDEQVRPWQGEPIATVESYLRSTAATGAGLWLLSTSPWTTGAALSIDAETMEPATLDLPAGTVAGSGDGGWALDVGDAPMLRHLGPDGRVDLTLPSPIQGGGQLWGDGRGGAWLVGDAMPVGDCCATVDYSVTRRAVAMHLDEHGVVTATWWSTGTTSNGAEWFTRFGDGLGWTSIEGLQLLSP